MIYFSGINYFAVVVSAIIYYFIGFIWYTILFSEIWGKETGVSMKNQNKPQLWALVGQFISTLLFTLGIAVILRFLGTYGITEGIYVSVLITVLIVIPINSGNLFFTGKRKLFFIDVCERAIGSLITGIILGIWK